MPTDLMALRSQLFVNPRGPGEDDRGLDGPPSGWGQKGGGKAGRQLLHLSLLLPVKSFLLLHITSLSSEKK